MMQEAKLLHARLVISGLIQQELHLRNLFKALAALNPSSLLHARLLFDQIHHPSTYIYNTIFRFYATSDPHQALNLYGKMHQTGPPPDNYTFPFLLKACSSIPSLHKGQEIHCQALKHGFGSHVYVLNSLIYLYGCNGEMGMANRVFDEMGSRDVATWTTLVTCYANFGSFEYARHVFDEMPNRSVVSYSAMIAGYVRRNLYLEALGLFRDMLVAKMEPNDSSIMSVLCACANLGTLDMGRWIHSYMCQKKHDQFDSQINTALIDMFFKCGSIKNALRVFQEAKKKYVGEWTAMLSGLAMNGLGDQLIEAFEDMLSHGVKPNSVTFVALLSGCTHAGLVDAGLKYFNRMKSDFSIEPSINHFGCIIDLLGRAGKIEAALELIHDMPFEANAAIWGSLLNACRVHKNVKIGELAARWLINDEPWNGALYMALMGLYMDVGRLDKVAKVKSEMKDVGCRKSPGCSLIEINGVCHEFVVGDKSEPCALDVCLNLGNVVMEYTENRLTCET